MHNICHLTSVHKAFDTRILLKECNSLAKFYNVTLIGKSDKKKIVNNVKIIPFPSINNRFIRILFSPIIMLFIALKQRSDIYHIHDPELIFLVIPLRLMGAKVIFDSHEHLNGSLHSKDYLNTSMIKLIKFGYLFLEKFILPIFSQIITATPAIKKELSLFNKNVSVINNYPIITEFINVSIEGKKDNTICYIGGITKIRGLKKILDSLDGVDITLSIAGKFDPASYRDELIKHRNWNKVKEYGFLDRTQMADLLQKSLAGMVIFDPLPNHINAQPNKIFEYMSAGIPVIGSNFELWKEIILDNNCGLCADPTNEQDIKNAIEQIIHNRILGKLMGENGKNLIEKKYNWNFEEKKLLHIYKLLLEKK